MTTGDRIHFLRNNLQLTLQELGDKVGVGASTVRKWETGLIRVYNALSVKDRSKLLNFAWSLEDNAN